MTETIFGKNFFDTYFDLLVWPMSHLLTWRGQDLWPILGPTTRGQSLLGSCHVVHPCIKSMVPQLTRHLQHHKCFAVAGFLNFPVTPVLTLWKVTCLICLSLLNSTLISLRLKFFFYLQPFFGGIFPILGYVPEYLHMAQHLSFLC